MEAWRAFLVAFTRHMGGGSPALHLLSIFAGLLVSWWLYVPFHELLHALGCWLGGGSIQSLEIDPLYGGRLLSNWLPFVVARSEYAGRLSGFDTGGSDWVYGLTIALPFVLVIPGWFLLQRSVLRGSRVLFGVSLPLALSPLLSLTGDFFEMSSLLLFQVWPGPDNDHRALISDDVLRLLGQEAAAGGMVKTGAAFFFVALSLLGSVTLALLFVITGHRIVNLASEWSSGGRHRPDR